jgi:hypothetical protein
MAMHPARWRCEILKYLDSPVEDPVLGRFRALPDGQTPQHLKIKIYFGANPEN